MIDEMPESQPPVAPLVLIAAVVSYFFMVPLEGWDVWLAAPGGALAAAVVGIPIAKFALRRGWQSGWAAPLLGAVAAWACLWGGFLLSVLASGRFEMFRGDSDLFIGYPARIAVPIGAISGLIYWLTVVRRTRN